MVLFQAVVLISSHIDSKAYDSMSIETMPTYPLDPWAFPSKVLRLGIIYQHFQISLPINFRWCQCRKMRYRDINRVQSTVTTA
jgi:hypothetical protein